ncbi:MAG: GDP-mannose 4,6-dehydratase [Candidatus Methanoperedens sp.]|nr:GDP-mannose 4,6-dehydratase [Candidatus Methanoperedens sp.]
MKRALITGVTGQDGSYLAELLLEKGYDVYGLVRRLSTPNIQRERVIDEITLIEGDLTDQSSLNSSMKIAEPDEVYNLAAHSFIATSWNQPVLTGDATGLGAIRVLESVRNFCGNAKVYQASSSEMFGKVRESPQNENTRFYPMNPYGCAKVYAYLISVNYRDSYNMFISNGILFNHESERRGLEFVTRKITDGVARIYYGIAKELRLGNLEARRDWGYAKDYVEAMWLMLQQKQPEDYVIATGEPHSVKDFVDLAFSEVGLYWRDYVKEDPKFIRPAEVDFLVGDASKARHELGWKPKVDFEELVKIMVKADLERVGSGLNPKK